MSATDIAKEVVRIANTHGLAKDVIDLLEKKLALLVEENAMLSTKVSRLEIENGQLRAQLQNAQPIGERLPEESEKMLVILANDTNGRVTSDTLIQRLKLPQARGDYFFDQLLSHELVATAGGQIGVGMFYHATRAGRDYLAKRGLL